MNSYEDVGYLAFARFRAPVMEAYRGTDIVNWAGQIEQSLVRMIRDAETANNTTYANRLSAYLRTWRNHPIDGSINRETLDLLHAAARQWAEEDWDFQTFFLGLSNSLSQLIASEEELPRGVDMDQNEPPGAGGVGGAGGGGHSPMPTDFGPQDEGPGGGGGGAPGLGGGEEGGLGGGGGGGDIGGAAGPEAAAGLGAAGPEDVEGAAGAPGAEEAPPGENTTEEPDQDEITL